ncbi:MAG: flagellar biosynthetic protein FliQ [Phycisphaerales bacterium]|nr:flagellar biosynthetic protein FliQ [Phycisphaerales bacterium]
MFTDDAMLEAVRTSLFVTIKIALPILAAGVAIGLTISIIQSVTQIQEQTLVFVPKILAMLIVTIAILHWIIERMGEFATDMFRLGFV